MPEAGGYVWADSALHRMPAAPRLALLVAAIAVCALARGPWGWLAATALVALLVALSHVGARRSLAAVWGLRWFLLAVLAMNALFFSREEALLELGPVALTWAGISQGTSVAARVALIAVLGSLLAATTRPQEMVNAVRILLRPLAALGANTEVAALAVGITVQFVPTLLRESRHLMRAQRARGAGMSSGTIFQRAADLVRLLVPVFVSAFRRADELSLAMEARGYRLDARPAGTAAKRRARRTSKR